MHSPLGASGHGLGHVGAAARTRTHSRTLYTPCLSGVNVRFSHRSPRERAHELLSRLWFSCCAHCQRTTRSQNKLPLCSRPSSQRMRAGLACVPQPTSCRGAKYKCSASEVGALQETVACPSLVALRASQLMRILFSVSSRGAAGEYNHLKVDCSFTPWDQWPAALAARLQSQNPFSALAPGHPVVARVAAAAGRCFVCSCCLPYFKSRRLRQLQHQQFLKVLGRFLTGTDSKHCGRSSRWWTAVQRRPGAQLSLAFRTLQNQATTSQCAAYTPDGHGETEQI